MIQKWWLVDDDNDDDNDNDGDDDGDSGILEGDDGKGLLLLGDGGPPGFFNFEGEVGLLLFELLILCFESFTGFFGFLLIVKEFSSGVLKSIDSERLLRSSSLSSFSLLLLLMLFVRCLTSFELFTLSSSDLNDSSTFFLIACSVNPSEVSVFRNGLFFLPSFTLSIIPVIVPGPLSLVSASPLFVAFFGLRGILLGDNWGNFLGEDFGSGGFFATALTLLLLFGILGRLPPGSWIRGLAGSLTLPPGFVFFFGDGRSFIFASTSSRLDSLSLSGRGDSKSPMRLSSSSRSSSSSSGSSLVPEIVRLLLLWLLTRLLVLLLELDRDRDRDLRKLSSPEFRFPCLFPFSGPRKFEAASLFEAVWSYDREIYGRQSMLNGWQSFGSTQQTSTYGR